MKIWNKSAFLLTALLISGQVLAELRYITDIIYVPMRGGPGNEYRILHRGLKTGTQLTLLEKDSGNGFSKVKKGDQEGYVRTQYLVSSIPAMQLLPEVEKKASKNVAENQELRQQLSSRDAAIEKLTTQVSDTEQKLSEQKAEMRRLQDITAEPMAIDRRNRQLIEENQALKNQVQVLQTENSQLVQDSSIKWYLYGGGTIFLGIILGLFLPMLRVRRKPSDWV